MKKNNFFRLYNNMMKPTINTSITLPVWQRGRYRAFLKVTRGALPQRLTPLLTQKARALKQANRSSAKQYNDEEVRFVKVSVRWPVDFYNRMHFLANHVRVSVSLLMHVFLLLWDRIPQLHEQSREKFCGNSYLTATREPHQGMISFKEVITFFTGGKCDFW